MTKSSVDRANRRFHKRQLKKAQYQMNGSNSLQPRVVHSITIGMTETGVPVIGTTPNIPIAIAVLLCELGKDSLVQQYKSVASKQATSVQPATLDQIPPEPRFDTGN